MFEKCQYTQTAGLFPPYCVDFPCNTQSIAASNRLVWRKNPSPSGTFPIFKQGLTDIEITEQNIKAFSAVAKKYDIDYALKKDSHTEPPHYYVFFKAKDKDQLQPAFKEFTAMTLGREKRPTIRERLAQAQEQTRTKHREREKVKTKDREVAR